MDLIDKFYGKYKIISIVGMAKNSGKTACLNSIIEESIEKNLIIGLISTGRDGESEDIISKTNKTRIFVEKDTIITTTTELLKLCQGRVEILNISDYKSPLGNILLGRMKSSGYVQISGPQTIEELKTLTQTILSLGVDLILIDGAIDRIASAGPLLSQACILSTGAVISRDINRVVEETAHRVNLFSLKEVDPKDKALLEDIIINNQIAIVDHKDEVNILNIKTAINRGGLISQSVGGKSKYIVISGSLVEKTLEDILLSTAYKENKDLQVVVEDGTKIFTSPKAWQRYIRMDLRIRVLYPINLIGITINPYSPDNYYFHPQEFLNKMKDFIKDIPIIDVMGGG